MLLVAPGETQFDLRFRILRIPVRVHPGFWVVSLILGWAAERVDLTLIWVACVFVSILVHELGHALTARSYGYAPWITLYHMGGLASFSSSASLTRGRAMFLSFAGPLAGFVLFGVVLAVDVGLQLLAPSQPWAASILTSESGANAIRALEFINLFWGLMNLLPIFPLDGGQMVAAYLRASQYNLRGLARTCQIGMVAGALAAIFLGSLRMYFGAILFAMLAVQNYQQSQQLKRGY